MSSFTLRIKDAVQLQEKDRNIKEVSCSDSKVTWPFSRTTTDPDGWRLTVTKPLGRLIWSYLSTIEERERQVQDVPARYFLGLMTHAPYQNLCQKPSEAIQAAATFHSGLQVSKLGCWASDLTCVYFVTPMLVFSWYITQAEVSEAYAIDMANAMFSLQDKETGGWPTYLEGAPTPMTSVLNYVALRLMGIPADDSRMQRGRDYILKRGGAAYIASWGKFWLCLLGLYEWDGTDPYPVEIWLLPKWLPVSPWNWLCITREVYLTMSYLYAIRFSIPSNPLLGAIRTEIFPKSYSSVNFAAFQGVVAEHDRAQAKSWVLKTLNWTLTNIWNPWLRSEWLFSSAKKQALELVHLSTRATNDTGIMSIDQFLMAVIHYATEGPKSPALGRLQAASLEFLWPSSNGIGLRTQSINSGHVWETALALQSYTFVPGLYKSTQLRKTIAKAYLFLTESQLTSDWPDPPHVYRFSRLGAWPFSTKYHGYACADCTGEALKALLLVQKLDIRDIPLPNTAHLRLAVDNLLFNQNPSGAYSTFERIRTNAPLEYLNGTEAFAEAMVEHPYSECTASAITALAEFRIWDDAGYRAGDIQSAIDRGINFIRSCQRPDGGWRGSWGISFTYGAVFALEALALVGETYENSKTVKRGCDFLMSKRHPDGGWGETIESILQESYTPSKESHTVQTAWSCLALMHAAYPDHEVIKQGLRLIMSRQRTNGEWAQEHPVGSGIFTCLLDYQNYIFTFPMRAIGMYIERYGDEILS